MTEFTLVQDVDPELVEDETEDEAVDIEFDLPEYDDSLFNEEDDDDEDDEDEDGEPE